MKWKRAVALALVTALTMTSMLGCSNAKKETSKTQKVSATESAKTQSKGNGGKVKQFTSFFAVPGSEINDDNEVQQKIAELTGAKVKETWLTGQTAQEAVGTLIAGGEYPDFIDGGDGMTQLYQAGALVQLDKYLDKYPNIKNFFSKEKWDKLRQADGHIYWIPQFNNSYGKSVETVHNDEAFWIQTRVLKWAGYPKITTLDQYFDLIEKYNAANPKMADGTKNIPYTILCDDWRYFCLENAPLFLDGYANDGSCIVDPTTKKAIDYNTTPTAKLYFQKLNTEFQKGVVDPESFTQKYDEYISKLSTGRVLGMVDQYWDFSSKVNDALKTQKLNEQGCNYVPLPITMKEGVQNHWHTSGDTLNVASGLAVTKSCKDIDGALKFVNDLLGKNVETLRNWGIKDADYTVDSKGLFSRTEDMRVKAADTNYKASHLCSYSYFPNWGGMSQDGINASKPDLQPDEFYASLPSDVQECFKAYNCKTYVDMIGTNEIPGSWYPIYSFVSTMTTATPGGKAWTKMGELKHEYLPKVVMASNFDSAWNDYMKVYDGCDPKSFLSEVQKEVDKRIATAQKSEASTATSTEKSTEAK